MLGYGTLPVGEGLVGMHLEQFRDIHVGDTAWVLGSGATLNFVDPKFFDDKLCFATNFVGREFGLKKFYCFSHYHQDSFEMSKLADFVFVPRLEHGCRSAWPHEEIDNVVLFDSEHGAPGERFDPFGEHCPDTSLVIGSSGLHGTMHLAAYMGCAHIVLVGADCGTLDGQDRFNGYPTGDTFWGIYNQHLMLMKQWLWQRFGCTVYSLNPFVNLNLEGHLFDGAK